MRLIIPGAAAVAALSLLWAQAGQIRDLRCENEVNPRTVKSLHPKLSWTWGAPAAPRGYQILVASTEDKLKAGIGDLWDTGLVRTDQKSAEYNGRPLTSFQRVYWKIRVWSDYDTPTFYTDPVTFQMALLHYGPPEGK